MNYEDVEKMLKNYIERGYLNLDPRDKNNIICYYKEDEELPEGFYSVSIEAVANDLLNDPENFKEFKDAIADAMENNITLTDFLNVFEFDYTIINSDDNIKYIRLIDLTETNLGNIENEYFEVSDEGILGIIERLDNYIQDYIFNELAETLERKYDIDVDRMNWKEMVEMANNLHCHYAFEEFVPYIFLDKKLKSDIVNKMILNDIEFEYSFESNINLEELNQNITDDFDL